MCFLLKIRYICVFTFAFAVRGSQISSKKQIKSQKGYTTAPAGCMFRSLIKCSQAWEVLLISLRGEDLVVTYNGIAAVVMTFMLSHNGSKHTGNVDKGGQKTYRVTLFC